MDIILCGPKGGGKSLHAAEIAADYLADGVQVYTTSQILWGGMLELCAERWGVVPNESQLHYLEPKTLTADDLMLQLSPGESELHPNILILDECGILFPVRGWKQNEEKFGAFINWLAQARKDKIDVVLVVQHADSLDSQILRQLAGQFAVYHRSLRDVPFLRFLRRFGNWGHIVLRTNHQISLSGKVKTDAVFRGSLTRPSPTAYKAYVTDQKYTTSGILGTRQPRCKLPRARVTAGWRGPLRQCAPLIFPLVFFAVSGCLKVEKDAYAEATRNFSTLTAQVAVARAELLSAIAVAKGAKFGSNQVFQPAEKNQDLVKTNFNILEISSRWLDRGIFHFAVDFDPDVFPGSYLPSHGFVQATTEHFVFFRDGSRCFLHLSQSKPDVGVAGVYPHEAEPTPNRLNFKGAQ